MYNPIVHGAKYIIPAMIYMPYLLVPHRFRGISIKTPLTSLIVFYFLIVSMELFNPLSYAGGWGGFYLTYAAFIHYLVYVPLFFIGFSIINDKNELYKIILTLIFILGLFNLFALVQMYQGLDFYARLTPSFLAEYTHYGYTGGLTKLEQPRPFSTYTTPYSLAIACMIEIFLCWAVFSQRKNINARLFWFVVIFFSVSCAALIFTYVRTVVLETIIGFLVFFLIKKSGLLLRFRNVFLLLIIILLFVKIVPSFKTAGRDKIMSIGQPFSAYKASRRHLPGNAFKVLKNYPLGTGLGRSLAANLSFFYKMDSQERKFIVAESNFIVILGDLSFIGLLIVILIFGKLIILGTGIIKKINEPDLKAIAVSIFGLLAGMIFNCPIAVAFDSAYFWFLTGVLLGIGKLKEGRVINYAGAGI